jgi:hypothetical protein
VLLVVLAIWKCSIRAHNVSASVAMGVILHNLLEAVLKNWRIRLRLNRRNRTIDIADYHR